jgi:hypothetical protein
LKNIFGTSKLARLAKIDKAAKTEKAAKADKPAKVARANVQEVKAHD